jgi:hypothetical protein
LVISNENIIGFYRFKFNIDANHIKINSTRPGNNSPSWLFYSSNKTA